MSEICDQEYALTPVIANEAINRNEITAVSKTVETRLWQHYLEMNWNQISACLEQDKRFQLCEAP